MIAQTVTTRLARGLPTAASLSPGAADRTLVFPDAGQCWKLLAQAINDIEALASAILELPATVMLVPNECYQVKATARTLPVFRTRAFQVLCDQTISRNALVISPSSGAPSRRRVRRSSLEEFALGFFAGAPIPSATGAIRGVLAVADEAPRAGGLTLVQQMTLRALAGQLGAQLDLQLALRDCKADAEAERERVRTFQVLAEQDALTGLPNRAVFHRRLSHLVAAEVRPTARAALMLIDVDHFKQVNDALGHAAGDALLRAFASRLREGLRGTDAIARLGGDEFGAILYDIASDEDLGDICRALDARLREPLTHEGRQITCRGSIGIAVYPDHARTPDELTKCADLALAAAKEQRGRTLMFRHEMGARFDAELDNISKARAALAAGRIVPGYQPKICLRSGAVTGFEALARLRLGDRLTEHCDMFAAAFRDPELGRAIGSCVVSQALDDMCAWRRAGVDFGRVAINSCAADFAADDFAERLLAGLAKRELEPALLELEVTENTFLGRGAQHVHRAIQLLSSRGVRIALDDFGTGFASLSHLKAFTVDVLKIDRAFITNVERDPDNAAIVRAVVGLARSLGLETVAEGVETLGQAACVTHMGCCTGQGYLYGTAGPASAVPRLLARAPAGRAA